LEDPSCSVAHRPVERLVESELASRYYKFQYGILRHQKENYLMAIVQISSKGQILIPGRIRKRMGLNPGASVQLLEKSDHLVLKAVPADPIAAATGFLQANASLTRDLLEEHKAEARRDRRTSRR
jgi:AbrB family looped-hinge helix DNA binding protein